MEGTQERLARNRTILYTAGGVSALVTIMATSLAIALLVGLLVNRPVSRMVAAIRGVEKGDLEARVKIDSSDELGVMGRSFNSMIDTIKRLNELKDDFISIVSHELRTPLTSIKYFSEVMLERIGTIQESRQKKYLRVINDETDRLTRLINDLLDLQKISSGKFRWKDEEIDIRKAIETTIQTFTGAAASRNVRFVERIEPNLPVILGDKDKAIQLIANLLSNAIKFTRVGSRVTISAEQGEDPDMLLDPRFRKYVKISVRDEGLGITPENLEKIFEKFQQVEDSVTRSKGGTGLGLSISKEIVQHHGGKIWAESAIPTGSIFSFTMPCESAEHDPVRKDPSGAQEVESIEGKVEPKEHAGAPKRTGA
jgi:signal transduction histidine kinase